MSIKVSLLGIGKMGRNHLRVLSMLKGVEVSYIYDVNVEALAKVSAEYGVAYTTDLDQAIEGVDAIYIVTPTSSHFQYSTYCMGKVKHIFIEKPIAVDLEQALQLKALAESHNTYVQCGFIERYNPVVSELKRVMDDKSIINADFTRTNKVSNRIKDVDVVLDLMVHDIDLALYLNGPVKSVFASGYQEDGLIALASAHLTHENGTFSRLLASRATEKKIRAIQVTATDAFIDAELLRKELVIHTQSQTSQSDVHPYAISSVEQKIEVRLQEALLLEHLAFISACKGEICQNTPNLESGVESIKIGMNIIEQIIK